MKFHLENLDILEMELTANSLTKEIPFKVAELIFRWFETISGGPGEGQGKG